MRKKGLTIEQQFKEEEARSAAFMQKLGKI